MHQTVVLNVVGLTGELLGEHTPHLCAFVREGAARPLHAVTPAVTCTAQATYLTGLPPVGHGIVANGWYFRDLAQIWLWRQSNHLVQGEKVWEAARRRDPAFTCSKMFWWHNMYADVDFSATPRPAYPADGRKIFDIYTRPPELRERLNAELGEFPFFTFWGPKSGLRASRWIAEAGRLVFDWEAPTLSLIYLPLLDYNLQRYGPRHPSIAEDLRAIDALCGRLIAHFRERGARVIVLSEYGITPVSGAVHINRVLREAGLIHVREELGLEQLDAGASSAFAVVDHQVAHIYVREAQRVPQVKALLEQVPGIERVLDRKEQAALHLDHERSGELVVISEPERWFTYYYWLDDAVAPDFARTVDIHRKPGFDPAELFIDPALRLPMLKVGWTLLRKTLGFRTLMTVIPLDSSLVGGSHGRVTDDPRQGPVFITSQPGLMHGPAVAAVDVKELILEHIFGT